MKKITLLIALMISSLGFAQNLITNGDFETSVTGWSGNVAVAGNIVTASGNSYISANVATAGNPYDVNLSYVTPMTTSGTAYKLTFQAWTSTTRTLIAGIGLNQDPWTNVTQTVNLTSTPTTFVLNLISNFASPTSRIIFDMGAAVGVVNIDNVILEVTTTTCNNGIQDGDETGVDCGGSCAPCVLAPTVAAPTPPNRNPSDVISLYSGAYTNVASNFDAGWCGSSSVQEVTIAGNPTMAFKSNNCQGIVLDSGIDASSFTRLHVDVYIEAGTDLTSSVFNLKFVQQPGGAAREINLNVASTPALVAGSWLQIDVPVDLSTFTGFKEFGITSNLNNKIWYDNLYAYKGTALGTASFAKSNIKMYPNPVKNFLNIEANASINKVSVYNILGQEVMKVSPKSNSATLQTADLQKGVYMITTDIDGNISTSKFLKE